MPVDSSGSILHHSGCRRQEALEKGVGWVGDTSGEGGHNRLVEQVRHSLHFNLLCHHCIRHIRVCRKWRQGQRVVADENVAVKRNVSLQTARRKPFPSDYSSIRKRPD